MKFPHLIPQNPFSYKMVLQLHFKYGNHNFTREYYHVKYKNGDEVIFMTSDELDEQYQQLYLREDFYMLFNYRMLLKDFDELPFLSISLIDGLPIIHYPSYLYYEPKLIGSELKEIFKEDLMKYLPLDKLPVQEYFIKNYEKWINTLGISE